MKAVAWQMTQCNIRVTSENRLGSQRERPSTLVIDTQHAKTRYPSLIDLRSQPANLLEDERKQFRASLPENPSAMWKNFTGRIAVVLSGGGARGAYEAG